MWSWSAQFLCWELNLDLLQEQDVFLATEPCLQDYSVTMSKSWSIGEEIYPSICFSKQSFVKL